MKTVTIQLEFESDEVTGSDVVDYLKHLIEDESLAFTLTTKESTTDTRTG